VWEGGHGDEILQAALPALEAGTDSPYTVAERIVGELGVPTR